MQTYVNSMCMCIELWSRMITLDDLAVEADLPVSVEADRNI